jgi:DNA-binding transcriptional regulator GbsR (MarR family)
MKINEAKERFIQAWGTLGSSWGINRSMSQVHALLLVSPGELSSEEIMEELNISRGNANMNIRALMDWGLVMKLHKPGDRKEYFYSEKDIWKVARQVIKERRKRELEPVLKVLEEVMELEGDAKNVEIKTFKQTVESIQSIVSKADKTLGFVMSVDESRFVSALKKMMS